MITNVELLKRLEALLFEGAEYVPLAWRVDTHGVQIYEAPDHVGKWVQQSCRCPECGHTWEAVAPYGSFGIECPACHHQGLWINWRER